MFLFSQCPPFQQVVCFTEILKCVHLKSIFSASFSLQHIFLKQIDVCPLSTYARAKPQKRKKQGNLERNNRPIRLPLPWDLAKSFSERRNPGIVNRSERSHIGNVPRVPLSPTGVRRGPGDKVSKDSGCLTPPILLPPCSYNDPSKI